MRAIIHERFGSPPEVLQVHDVEKPAPGAHEVLVRVKAAAVAKGDWLMTNSVPYIARPMFGIRRPKRRIAGLEFAGVVEQTGPGADGVGPGDPVFGWVDGGALAEFVIVPETQMTAKPVSISFEQAAAIPMSGLAGYEAVAAAGDVAGKQVLITGASGGVGSFAVQVAKAAGAEVTGVASGRNRDFVLGLGADHFIDYTTEEITEGGRRYDVVIDIAGNRSVSQLRRALTPKGAAVLVGGEGGNVTMGYGRTIRAVLVSPFISQQLTGLMSKPSRRNLEALAALIDSGDLTPQVGATYPLERAGDAVESVGAGRSHGKTVVTV